MIALYSRHFRYVIESFTNIENIVTILMALKNAILIEITVFIVVC